MPVVVLSEMLDMTVVVDLLVGIVDDAVGPYMLEVFVIDMFVENNVVLMLPGTLVEVYWLVTKNNGGLVIVLSDMLELPLVFVGIVIGAVESCMLEALVVEMFIEKNVALSLLVMFVEVCWLVAKSEAGLVVVLCAIEELAFAGDMLVATVVGKIGPGEFEVLVIVMVAEDNVVLVLVLTDSTGKSVVVFVVASGTVEVLLCMLV
jgi:hypothetical protein